VIEIEARDVLERADGHAGTSGEVRRQIRLELREEHVPVAEILGQARLGGVDDDAPKRAQLAEGGSGGAPATSKMRLAGMPRPRSPAAVAPTTPAAPAPSKRATAAPTHGEVALKSRPAPTWKSTTRRVCGEHPPPSRVINMSDLATSWWGE
jgi:hypothetical protein